MPLIIALHHAVAFGLELAMLFGFGRFGFISGQGGWTGGLLAAGLVAGAIVLWARFAAPKSSTRLTALPLIAFKLAIFALAALAYWASGWTDAALVFALLAALDLWASVRFQ